MGDGAGIVGEGSADDLFHLALVEIYAGTEHGCCLRRMVLRNETL
jgi:hypothetical protein